MSPPVTAAPGSPDDPGDGRAPGNPGDPAGGEGPGPAQRDPRMVLDAYFLRSLTFAGYAPALEECARCGSPGTVNNAAGRERR